MATLNLGECFMKAIAKKVYGSYTAMCSSVHVKFSSFIHSHASKALFTIGICFLVIGLTQIANAQIEETVTAGTWDAEIGQALSNIFGVIEGSFGALVMVVAGLAAIIAAAMGAYKGALGCLVVAVGAFILRSMVRLFFGDSGGLGTASAITVGQR